MQGSQLGAPQVFQTPPPHLPAPGDQVCVCYCHLGLLLVMILSIRLINFLIRQPTLLTSSSVPEVAAITQINQVLDVCASFVTCNGSCKTCLWVVVVCDLVCVNIVIWTLMWLICEFRCLWTLMETYWDDLRWFVACFVYILWFVIIANWNILCYVMKMLYSTGSSCCCFLWKE